MATDVQEPEQQVFEQCSSGIPTDPAEILARAERILGGDIRPEDYLPVTDEIESVVQQSIRTLVKYQPEIIVNDEGTELLRRDTTLGYYCGGKSVLARSGDGGVIVLAMGGENVQFVYRHVSPDKWAGFGIKYPTAWGSEN